MTIDKQKQSPKKPDVMDGLSVQHGSTPDESDTIIVLWGWIGGQLRHVEKYAQIYHEQELLSGRDKNKKVTTISGVTKSLYKFFFQGVSALDDYVLETTQEIAKVLSSRRDAGKAPPTLVFHVFSNGGVLPLLRLHELIQQTQQQAAVSTNSQGILKNNDTKTTKLTPSMIQNFELVQEALESHGGFIFDSCPAYPSPRAVSLALSSSLQKVLPSIMCHALYFATLFCFSTKDFVSQYILNQPTQAEAYWKTFKDYCGRHAKYHLFLYSSQDEITIAEKVREFASHSRNNDPRVAWVKEVDFHDSQHVTHYRKHPQEYINAIKELFEAIAKKNQSTKHDNNHNGEGTTRNRT